MMWCPQMVGANAFAAMKPTGVFINVGRGKCVDEAALVQALQVGGCHREVHRPRLACMPDHIQLGALSAGWYR